MEDLKKTNKLLRLIALCEKHQGDSKKMLRDMTSCREKLMFSSSIDHYIEDFSEKYQDLVNIITFIDEDYPLTLKSTLFPPPLLFAFGNIKLLNNLDPKKIKCINSAYSSHSYYVVEKQLDNKQIDYCLLTTYYKDMPLSLYEQLNNSNFDYVHYSQEKQLLNMVENHFIQEFNQNLNDWKTYIESNYKEELESSIHPYPDYYESLSM